MYTPHPVRLTLYTSPGSHEGYHGGEQGRVSGHAGAEVRAHRQRRVQCRAVRQLWAV